MGIRVLLVDDHKVVRDGVASMLGQHADIEIAGHAAGAPAAIAMSREVVPDIVVMDVKGPRAAGAKALRQLCAGAPGTRVLALSLHSEWSSAVAALDAGAMGYVLKDNAFEELAPAIRTVITGGTYISPAIRRHEEFFDTIGSVSEPGSCPAFTKATFALIEARDPLLARHLRRVAQLSVAIAEDLGLCADDVTAIRCAALLHDVGTMSVPKEVLEKPDALGSAEVRLVQSHAETGRLVLLEAKVAEPLPELVYQHHERCDGSGYPRGLRADEILLGARILGVADVVEAMSSRRPYRPRFEIEVALEEIESGAAVFYDEHVVASCLHLFRDCGFTFTPVE